MLNVELQLYSALTHTGKTTIIQAILVQVPPPSYQEAAVTSLVNTVNDIA